MKVGIVAGEKSGDYLGSQLIKALKLRYPDAEFVGLCGPLMQKQGAVSLAEMEKISIMGFSGLFSSLFEILSIRKKIKQHMLAWRPDVFVGIDVPDFNLTLERHLKEQGIPTVHYVSPTVWAWRGGRIKKIRKAVELMLCMFPFEETFYQQKGVPVQFVGHPLAKQVLNWQVNTEFLNQVQTEDKKLIALLPGSRMSEVTKLAPIMLKACIQLSQNYSDITFVIPASSDKIKHYLTDQLKLIPAPVQLVDGHSHDLLAASYLAVLASGTAALEAALFAKPMVVMYKVSKLEELYAASTMEVEHFSMPNHLTNPPVIPELIQKNANVENMVTEVRRFLDDPSYYQHVQSALRDIAPALQADSGALACDAIERLVGQK